MRDASTAWVRKALGPRWPVLRLLADVGAGLTVAVAVAVLAAPALMAAMTIASAHLIAAIPGATGHGLASPSGWQLVRLVLLVAMLLVLGVAVRSLQAVAVDVLSRRIDRVLRHRLMLAALRPAGIAHLEDPAALDDLRNARGVGSGQYTPGRVVAGIAGQVSMWLNVIVGAALVAYYFSPALALLVVATTTVSRRLALDWCVSAFAMLREQVRSMRQAEYHRDLAISPDAAKEIRLLALGHWVRRRFADLWSDAHRFAWQQRGQGGWSATVAVLPGTAGTTLVLAIAAFAAARHHISVESLVVVLSGTLQAGSFSVGLPDAQVRLGGLAIPALQRFEERTAVLARAEVGRREPLGRPHCEIRFEAVRFRYPGADRDVFSGLDLVIPAGVSTALVGANGTGKTTLLKLAARLYEPVAGRITADHIDIREFDAHAWQRRFAAVFQDIVHYDMTVWDNVAHGAAAGDGDEVDVAEAAARAGAVEMIEALQDGWQTVLSRRLPGAVDLSGGQWQQIALARMVRAMHAGAGILILDEPTANLSAYAEAAFFERFADVAQGMTTILVSHRLASVRLADRICVLGPEGIVVEQGTHDELVERAGVYAHMFSLQAASYREAAAHD